MSSSPSTSPRRSWWGDRGVKVKVLTAVGAAAVVAAGVGVMGLTALGTSADTTHTLYASNLAGVSAVGDMNVVIGEVRKSSRDALITPDRAEAQQILDALPRYADDYHAAVDAYAASFPTPEKQELVDRATAAFDQYMQLAQGELGPLAIASDNAGWYAANKQDVAPLAAEAEQLIGQVRDTEVKEAAAADVAATDQYGSQRTLSLVLLAVGLALALAIGWTVARGIARGVARVKSVSEALAAGDLTRSSGLTTRDELGLMGQALDSAVDNLRGVMAGVVASSDAVAAASEELSASSSQIAASAEETSVQSGVVSTAAEEVSRSVSTVAAGAEQMGASIREISQNANEAARVAAQAVTEAEATTRTITALGTSSQEIGAVVKVITSIAEQTNLLALNATIEAARAGEAGKGFAVVANEVKELAQETARATEDIARRVEAIQGDTSRAVQAITGISTVIGSINDYQLTIASAVEEQTATTNEMSRSVQEAAGGSTEIAANITGVSTAADSTTQALSQSRQAVDELSRMASDLRGSVARFTF